MKEIAEKSKLAAMELRSIDNIKRKEVLIKIASLLEEKSKDILTANVKDIVAARESNLSSAMVDRLILNDDRVKAMANGVRDVANQEDFLGQIVEERVDSSNDPDRQLIWDSGR